MGRHGYSDDLDSGALNIWRGAVTAAIRGKRGQAFLREMLTALDAMPVHALIAHELKDAGGGVCAIGTVGASRGIDMAALDPCEYDDIAKTFGISQALVREIEYENDDFWAYGPNPDNLSKDELRWAAIRRWCVANIKQEVAT